MFVYTSCDSSFICEYFHSTATIKSSFDELTHLADLLGYQNFVYVVKLSVSIIIGLVHSIVIDRLEPIVASVELINSSHGFFKSVNPFSHIVKIPISEVAQNLFLRALSILRLSYLSHSK
ncbi:hypothetical protein ACFLY2_03210 [Patescibacteria group bacterium]